MRGSPEGRLTVLLASFRRPCEDMEAALVHPDGQLPLLL